MSGEWESFLAGLGKNKAKYQSLVEDNTDYWITGLTEAHQTILEDETAWM